jgi:hypothetical protein
MRTLRVRPPVLQGAYFLVTGIWPLLSRRSFERVTGPKADFWLAQTVGVLVVTIGAVLLVAERRQRVKPEVAARTCVAVEKVATTAIVQVELGEQTREMLGALAVPGEGAGKAREAVGGIVKKARNEAKRVTKS